MGDLGNFTGHIWTCFRWIIFGLLMTWLIPIFTFVVPVSATWNCANNCECYIPVNGTTDVIYMFCFPFDKCSLVSQAM